MRKLWLGILGLAAASTANAAVVTFTLSLHESATGAVSANGWALYATVSQGDNAGLFAFGVDLKGTGDAGGPTTLTMANRSPSGTWDADPADPNYDPGAVYPTKFAGYGAGRSTSTATGIVSGVTDLSKGGDLIPVFGIGQNANIKMNDSKPPPDTSTGVPVAYANYVPAAGSDQTLGNPFNRTGVSGFVTLPAGTVRLATGTWSGNLDFDLGSVNTKASVWKTSHPLGTENEIAQSLTQVRDFNPQVGTNTLTVANAPVGNNLATDGKIVVTGGNNSYVSEVDQLTADLNAGSANVQTIGDEAGTLYVMAQITGTASDVNAILASPLNNASGSSQAALLHANYDAQFGPGGFNLLFSMPNFAGAKNINWSFQANPGAVVNELAIVPEPGTISLLGLGALGLLARRRRNA